MLAAGSWADLLPIVLPVALGMAAIYLLLPRPRNYSPWWGALLGGVALQFGGGLLIRTGTVLPEAILFAAFSLIAIVAGTLLITQRNPARAALSFALVVLSTCGLFLMQAAPFLMAATTIIYAGAIVVTFLFVIMLAQQEGRSDADHRSREPGLAIIGGFVLLGAILYVLQTSFDTRELDRSIVQLRQALSKQSPAEVTAALGNDKEFFEQLGRAVARSRGRRDARLIAGQITEDWFVEWQAARAKNHLPSMQNQLIRLEIVALKVRHDFGSPRPDPGTRLSTFSDPVAASMEPLAPALEFLTQAASEPTLEDLQKTLSLPDLAAVLKREGQKLEPPRVAAEFRQAFDRLEETRRKPQATLEELQDAVTNLLHVGLEGYRAGPGTGRLPAENTAYLGLTLFTDYLLAVELGGTLLLVATIGAIAIASRRAEKEP